MDWLLGILIFLVLIITIISVRKMDAFKAEVQNLFAQKNEHFDQLLMKYSQQLQTLNSKTEEKLMNLFAENKEINEQLHNDLIRNYTAIFQEMVDQHAKIIHDVTKNMMTNLDGQFNDLNKNFRKQIDIYLEQEKQEIEKWLETVENYKTNHLLAIELLESALNKYPSSRALMEKYRFHIMELIQSSEKQVRKLANEKYNRAARVFLDNCSYENWNLAKEIMDESLKLGNQYMKETEEKRRENAAYILSYLEEKVGQLKPGVKLTDDEIDELERIDKSIDKNYVQQIPELRDRYAATSQKFMQYFSNMENDEEAIKKYNLQVVHAIKEAHNKFQADEKWYKQGNGVSQLVSLLGGWDANLLQPATQIYFQSVYSDIFAKLNPNIKPYFTEKMLQESKKEIR